MQIERYLDRRYTVAKEKEKEVHALDEVSKPAHPPVLFPFS